MSLITANSSPSVTRTGVFLLEDWGSALQMHLLDAVELQIRQNVREGQNAGGVTQLLWTKRGLEITILGK